MKTASSLLIFVKNPELGKVKTRLAKTLGDEKALEIYQYLLSHTQKITRQLSQVDRMVFYSSFVEEEDSWDRIHYLKFIQKGRDLGERMAQAFQSAFEKNNQKVVIIGSDCLELNTEIIEEAFRQLDHQDFVIGPARDGGYYLLGMRQPEYKVFQNKNWSTASVFSDTIKDIEAGAYSYALLPVLSDVDHESDLEGHILP